MDCAKATSPHLFSLVLSKDQAGKVNVMALSWMSLVSFQPPKMMVSISQKGLSHENIKQSGFFTVCFATETIKQEAFRCGTLSGRQHDKIKETGLELLEIEGFRVPALQESTVALALEVTDSIQAGDHTVFLADIKESMLVKGGKNLLAFDGYERLEPV